MLDILIGVGGSIVSSLISSSSARSAANAQYDAQRRAAELMATSNRTIAERDLEFQNNMAQSRYDAGIRTLDHETLGQTAALDLERDALALESQRVQGSYDRQLQATAEIGTQAIADEVNQRLRDFETRSEAIHQLFALRMDEGVRQAEATVHDTLDRQSDAAREADRAAATARVAAGERGAAGSNTYLRLMNEAEYYKGLSVERIRRDGDTAIASLQNGLQTAAVEANADLQFARQGLLGTLEDSALDGQRLLLEAEQITAQRYFDLEALGLEEEGLQTQQELLQQGYDLASTLLGEELSNATLQNELTYDNAMTQIDAQEEALLVSALAQRSSAVSLANSSFFTNVISSGINAFGNYYTRSQQLDTLRDQLGLTSNPTYVGGEEFGFSFTP